MRANSLQLTVGIRKGDDSRKLWQQFVTKAISQFVSARLFAYLSGNSAVIWLALAKCLDQAQTHDLLRILFYVFFGVKGIEWIGNAVGSITMKPKPTTPGGPS